MHIVRGGRHARGVEMSMNLGYVRVINQNAQIVVYGDVLFSHMQELSYAQGIMCRRVVSGILKQKMWTRWETWK